MIKNLEKKPEEFVSSVKKAAENADIAQLVSKAREADDPVSAYAAAYNALKKGLGITPFDSQILAGAYLDGENIAELATGEGKTAAAVFAAFYAVCKKERVHILTFNDYLAKRDSTWMKPAYELLGVSVSCITELTEKDERRKAYRADVVYTTVKECGFDFLRDFLVFSPEDAVGCGYDRAIVDEADSLLIDEARIPLVAAGSMEAENDKELPEAVRFAGELCDGDYETDAEGSVYLTDKGAKKAEAHYGTDNIYDEENNGILARINDSLKALYILSPDKDYIIKDGQIKIIDAFTGRIAENRSYPGFLQAALELKHGLHVTERGVVMGSVPIQFFIRQYKKVSGMTGTALSARDEFAELYGLIVKHVEPHTPSIRRDLPMAVYYDEESKLKAVVSEVKAAHEAGQPVLIGTADIEQSERLSAMLTAAGTEHNVLNAKNDELEADIIKDAGAPGAVTVSTSMAGRGVDIKLGGADEAKRGEAAAAGGLYAICTYMAESARINDQLKGRAARQGDPGQSRMFVSLDEDIMSANRLAKLLPHGKYPSPTTEEIKDKTVIKEVGRIQRISQGKKLDERVRLLKFTMIGEKHRDLVFSVRKRYISGEAPPEIWQKAFPELYEKAEKKYGAKKLSETQTLCAAAQLNLCWSRYLEYTAYLREGIHLSAIGGKNPSEEYNIACEEYYEDMEDSLTEAMGKALSDIAENGIDSLKIPKPGKISTYLLEDTGDELERRTLADFLLGDDDEDEDEDEDENESEENGGYPGEDEDSGIQEKKPGFFARLFGKKR